jgi:UDP-N-acetylglucosamine--N-acetylmuramyl-(pentapeptide) pyrophosphoryl-undecaprenol N-acetylglucosamine transferase
VFSTGGYVSFPLSLAAMLRGVPVFLLELNVVPGLAARVIGWFARRVFTGFAETVGDFGSNKSLHTGIPTRREIRESKRVQGREVFGLYPKIQTLFIVGGSQGSRNLNHVVASALRFIGEGTYPLQAVFMTGRGDYQAVADVLEKCPMRVVMSQFISNIHEAYAAADLVVARSGAMTCAELTARGLPSVLVPYPYAGGHQERNARALEAAGAALVLTERDLDSETLAETLLGLLQDSERLGRMAEASRSAGRPDAAATIWKHMKDGLERKAA